MLQRKMEEYLENGARLGWLIDPINRRVHVYRPGEPVQVLESPETVSGNPVLPGFELDLVGRFGKGANGMEPFVKIDGVAAPLDRVNVDTDAIIPAIHLKSIRRTGYGQFLFERWRFNEDGSVRPEFVLNQPSYSNASILVAGRNFGCGSSREHAPWALSEYGIRCVIAPSFADIFFNNCFQNGLLPIVLPEETVRQIMDLASENPGIRLHVDLEAQRVWDENEEIVVDFDVDQFRRYCLLNGLDDIGLTLQQEDKISSI